MVRLKDEGWFRVSTAPVHGLRYIIAIGINFDLEALIYKVYNSQNLAMFNECKYEFWGTK